MPPLIRQVELNVPKGDWRHLSVAILADGSLARLQADFDVLAESRERQQVATAGETHVRAGQPLYPEGTRARIVVHDGTSEVLACAFDLPGAFPAFDRLSNGGWIIADSRCDFGKDNAVRLSADGAVEARFCLGDGISDLQCDTVGGVWVGYFDEGIFGNYGWGRDGREPIGSPGLVRFNTDGQVEWRYEGLGGRAGGPWIADCEALNVADGKVWCSVDSPTHLGRGNALLRICSDSVTAWRTETSLAKAIAVDGARVATVSGPWWEPPDFNLQRLDADSAISLGSLDLARLGLGASWPDAAIGRGADLHHIQSGLWSTLSVEALANSLGG